MAINKAELLTNIVCVTETLENGKEVKKYFSQEGDLLGVTGDQASAEEVLEIRKWLLSSTERLEELLVQMEWGPHGRQIAFNIIKDWLIPGLRHMAEERKS